MCMKTSRQQILDYIRAQKSVTSFDLSRALGMTRANARHHLEILKDECAVEVTGQRQAQARGRPSLVYSLSESILGHNLDRLALAFLEDVTLLDETKLNILAERIARKAGNTNFEKSEGLTSRLYKIIQQLNEMHYFARWEARVGAPRIIFGHCPYRVIIDAHPELCKLDTYLLQNMTGYPAEQISKLVPDWRGGTNCTFRMRVSE